MKLLRHSPEPDHLQEGCLEVLVHICMAGFDLHQNSTVWHPAWPNVTFTCQGY